MSNFSTLFKLTNKVALVTGATGHFGRPIAYALAEAGAKVILNGRDEAKLLRMMDEMAQEGLTADIAVFDIADVDAVIAHTKDIISLDILVNNAYKGNAGSIANSSGKDYLSSYDVSVVSTHNLVTALLPALRRSVEKGYKPSVINIASMYGLVSPKLDLYSSDEVANPPFYGAAKAALIQWTRYAACEFGSQGVRFNSVSPGAFPNDEVCSGDPIFVSRLASQIPLARVGASSEIAGPVLFLASPASSYVNGENLVVDGGWTCW